MATYKDGKRNEPATALRVYTEAEVGFGSVAGAVQTGLAIANPANSATSVLLELFRLDGSSTPLSASFTIPANGQASTFLNQIPEFAQLATPFQGVLRVTSPTPISVSGLRARYNENGDFLITTTPPINESAIAPSAEFLFPQLAEGGGYETQFILYGGSQSFSGRMVLTKPSAAPLGLIIR